jgi:hypothetical protein
VKVAVIGAGLSAAAAVEVLQAKGCQVTVFEKSRGAGGRFSSKRVGQAQLSLGEAGGEAGQPGYADFGAQYFTARTPDFLQQLALWQQQQQVRRWPQTMYCYDHAGLRPSPDQQQRFIAVPHLQQLLKPVFSAVDTRYNCRVTELSFVHDHPSFTGWQVATEDGQLCRGYDALLLTCPAQQSRQLLTGAALTSQIPPQPLLPCWAVLLELAEPTSHPADAIFIRDHALRFAARQNDKPGRLPFSLSNHTAESAEQWLVHLSAEASVALLQASSDEVIAAATKALSEVLVFPLKVQAALAHRWLYASYDETVPPCGVLFDQKLKLAVAGDWTLGGRVENAWLSGRQAAALLINSQGGPQ